MQRQTTGIMFSYINKSAYHDNCMPRQTVGTQASPGGPGPSEAQLKACDAVTQDKVWKQSVASERRCLQNWDENWGFLTEYDSKGQPIEKEELPEKMAVFSNDVPNTNAGNYGSRLSTDPGRTMQNLEFQFYSDRRRRKLDSEMVCY
ncbi:ciliary microtubule inner protein 5-like isoform X2 [Babylonia areolata]|uniref:ciliary microtubule inner protein 5-like isoform X2 n=1 Tax=Babylonia areolata TaxID=304850 RepID=UPI003FCF2BDA